MMDFKDFCFKTDFLEEFDTFLEGYESLNESNLGDLDIASVIMSGMDNIKSQDVKAIIGAVAIIAKLMGRRVKDIIKLFSKSGFEKIKRFIDHDIIGSKELQYLIRMKNDPNRYKGYGGLEQYILDLKKDEPALFDSLEKAVGRLFG